MPKSRMNREDRKLSRHERKREREAEHSSNGYPSKRRAEGDNRDHKPAETTIVFSEEEAFKQKHASEFEDYTREPSLELIEIKSEPREDRGSQTQSLLSPVPTGSSAKALVGRDLSPVNASTSQNILGPEDGDADDRQSALDTILSHRFGLEMTQPAIKQILKDAQDSSNQNNEFGICYIEAQIDRLRQKNVPPQRLTEVIQFLQTGLRDLTQRFSTRIDSLGDRTMPPVHTPNGFARHNISASKCQRPSADSSDQRLQSTISRSLTRQVNSGKDSKRQSRITKASHYRRESSPSSSDASGPSSGRKVEEKRGEDISNAEEEFREDNGDCGDSTGDELMNTSSKKSNVPLYGCRRPKNRFDVYARCAILSCMTLPGDADTAMDIRVHAQRVWRAATKADKVEWDRLFVHRHSDAKIFKKGRVLLETQGLLSRLKPDFLTASIPSKAKKLCPADEDHRATPNRPLVQHSEDTSRPDLQVAATPPKTPPTANTVCHADEVSQDATSNRPIAQYGEDKRRRKIMTLFPYLTQATSLTPTYQPCYVPFASRGVQQNRGCLFVINTPDTNTGRLTTDQDVRTACQQRNPAGLIEVVGCNNNVVSASFASYGDARMARNFLSIVLPSTAGHKVVSTKAEFHLSRAPKFFSCDATSLEIEHDTVASPVSQALRGRRALELRGELTAPYKLLRQETHDANDDRMKYLLRFDDDSRPPGVQCFYIPFDAESGGGKIWGIFRPENRQGECVFCGAVCQLGRNSTCHFTTVIGSQDGPEP